MFMSKIRLRTSYYASPKVKQIVLDDKEEYLIGVSRYSPFWFYPVECLAQIAPDKEKIKLLKSGEMSEEEFTRLYIEKVEPLLDDIKFRHGSVLLCYEPSDEFCHRHVLAKLLRARGYEIEEL